MIIKDITIVENSIPLVTPFKTALRTVDTINDICIKVHTDTGSVGYGEAAPTAVITGDTKSSIKEAIQNFIKPNLIGLDILNTELIFKRLNGCIQKNYSAKAAVDMAIYDLFAQELKVPLYQLLGGAKNTLNTDITISLNSVNKMVEDSINAINNGFNILKIKLGCDFKKDIERISEIRKVVGENTILRVDANQGWGVKEAIYMANKMDELSLDIELIEQPVKYDNLEGLKKITDNTYTKILADESVFSPKEAMYIIQNRAADAINIKLMKTGGIYNALKIIAMAEVYEVECMMGCMLESIISVTAAAHLAAAKDIITMIDLDGPILCKEGYFSGGVQYDKSKIMIPNCNGLGFIM